MEQKRPKAKQYNKIFYWGPQMGETIGFIK